MTRPYPYYPAWDGKKASALIEKVAALLSARYGGKSIGTYSARLMKNDHTAGKKIGDPGMEKYLSVHATGYALDWSYAGAGKKNGCTDEELARTVWDFLLANSKDLGICEVHWYAYGDYGAGYRCSRGEGKTGVKIFTKDDNAGSYQGSPAWLHIEVDHKYAGVDGGDVKRWEEVFRSLKT